MHPHPRPLLLCALALLMAGAGGGVPTDAEDVRPPTPAEIDRAIERGVTWVVGEQKPQGPWGSGKDAVGKTALAVFALLHCGLAEDQGTKESRRLVRALGYLDGHGAGRPRRRESDTRTYEASLLLMLLRARGRPEDRGRMQRLADLLCRTQRRNGQWWYDGKGAPHGSAGDNSNTQFAALALGVARGEGLKVPDVYLRQMGEWWENSPGNDGGFGYSSGGSAKSAATGSMTAAGIACLAIVEASGLMPARRSIVDHGQPETRFERVKRRAIEFLAARFSVTRNHGPSIDRKNQRQRLAGRGWMHYYLWTVERAMVLAGLEKLGDHDWYAEGARRLVDTQKKDGSWRQEHPLYATCFALLFLTRAADPPRAFTPRTVPDPHPPGTGPPITQDPKPPADGPAPVEPDTPPRVAPPPTPPGTVAEWLREEDQPVGEMARRCRLAGAGSLLPLVRALQDPSKRVRRRAFEALTALLPDVRTRRVDRHPLPRGRLALWLRTNLRHLVLRDGVFLLR